MDSLLQVTLTQGKIQYFTGISSQKQSSKNLPTRLQLFWLHLRLLHRMLRLVIEGRVVVVLVLVGLVQSLRLISWWDWGIKVEHLRVNKDHIVVKPEPEERSQAHYPLFPQYSCMTTKPKNRQWMREHLRTQRAIINVSHFAS